MCPETDRMDPNEPEEILLDANKEAEQYTFYILGSFEVSPDHSMLAYAEDVTGATSFQCNPALKARQRLDQLGELHYSYCTCRLCTAGRVDPAVSALQATKSTCCL